MKTEFRLSLRRPAIWAAAWVLITILAVVRFGWVYLPFTLLLGVLLIVAGLWANAGPGVIASIDGSGPSLIVRTRLSGTEEVPWKEIEEAAVIQRLELLGLYPLLRLQTQSGRNIFLPLYLIDDPEGLKALVITRAGLRSAPMGRGTESERWARRR